MGSLQFPNMGMGLRLAAFGRRSSAINNKQMSPNFLFQNTFFFESDFCPINPHFLYPISKMFCNFSLKLNMANRRHVFLALWPRKRRNTLNKRKTKFALTGSAQKVIWVLAFRSREKFDNSFFFQNFWYSLIASPISFNLI